VTCHRFGRSRLGATTIGQNLLTNFGVKPPKTKAATGRRTPKELIII
jgi:hypothetical protein